MIGRHILIWVILFFVGLFLVPIVLPPEAATQRIRQELAAAGDIFGAEKRDDIVVRANSFNSVLVVQTGLAAAIAKGYTTEEELRRQGVAVKTQRNIGSGFNRYLHTATIQLYGVFLRISIVFSWMGYIGFFLAALIVDGFTQRAKKFATGGEIETVKYALGAHAVVLGIGVPFAYLVYPFNASPWFVVVWVILLALPLTLAIRNMAGLR
jgi:hypothetical protein